VLREAYTAATGKKRIDFTTDQRRRLALKGKALKPHERKPLCQIVRPRTILDWFRQLAAAKYDSCGLRKARGKPPKPDEIRRGPSGPGNQAEPPPERSRQRTWGAFLRSHWETLYACDFFAVETLRVFGTVRYMVFFVMELKTRTVQIAGIRIDPDGAWMAQMARNLTDPLEGFLRNATHLIHDRDPLFTEEWTALLKPTVKCARTPASSPNCNPHAERFVRSMRTECLDHLVIFGERHLRYLLREYIAHYHTERPHQGLGGELINAAAPVGNDNGAVKRRSRFGGLLNFYHRGEERQVA
jgi:hypothetical protein